MRLCRVAAVAVLSLAVILTAVLPVLAAEATPFRFSFSDVVRAFGPAGAVVISAEAVVIALLWRRLVRVQDRFTDLLEEFTKQARGG